MLDIMLTAVNAIGPVITLIVLGYCLKRSGLLSGSFAKTGNQLVFQVGLPVMLFVNVYDIEGLKKINWSVAVFSVLVVGILFVIGLAAAVSVTQVPERRGVILQCTFRSNFAIIGLSLAGTLGGEGALAVAAIVSAITIPVYNVLAVISLTMFMDTPQKGNRWKTVLFQILRNPLIQGVAAGIVCLLLREVQLQLFSRVLFSLKRDLPFVYDALCRLKSMTTPLALLVLGAQFAFSAVKGLFKEILTATVLRTILSPLVGLGLAVVLSGATGFFDFGPMEYPALVALFGSPVAVSSAVMAGSMGNDEQLASQLVVWTSLVSIVTIFLQICLLLHMGLLVM